MNNTCPFCSFCPENIWCEVPQVVAVWDSFPVTEGHLLIVPTTHVQSLFELDTLSQIQLWSFVSQCRDELVQRLGVTSFNIGINDGKAAGQTIDHAHIHIIPRRDGDHIDPRGGIRWVVPERAAYWEAD
jgi:diadenosine tetraphosphate (Ap4A) HIT family hydrolase